MKKTSKVLCETKPKKIGEIKERDFGKIELWQFKEKSLEDWMTFIDSRKTE